jgi:hypothetical protein
MRKLVYKDIFDFLKQVNLGIQSKSLQRLNTLSSLSKCDNPEQSGQVLIIGKFDNNTLIIKFLSKNKHSKTSCQLLSLLVFDEQELQFRRFEPSQWTRQDGEKEQPAATNEALVEQQMGRYGIKFSTVCCSFFAQGGVPRRVAPDRGRHPNWQFSHCPDGFTLVSII